MDESPKSEVMVMGKLAGDFSRGNLRKWRDAIALTGKLKPSPSPKVEGVAYTYILIASIQNEGR